MPADVNELLRDAAPMPASEPDIAAAWQRGRRLGRRRWLAAAVAVLLGVSAAPLAIALVTNRSEPGRRIEAKPSKPSWPTYRDDANGFSVQIPPGWQRSQGPLVPNLVNPREIISLGTYTLPSNTSGPACDAQLPLRALQDLGPEDVFLWIVESNPAQALSKLGSTAPRPKHFGARGTRTLDCSSQVFTPGLPVSTRYFTDRGRTLGTYVVFGENVSQARKAETWHLLDTLRFDTLKSFSKERIHLRYPKDWRVANRNLTPGLGDPHEVVSLGTFAMKPADHNCTQVPVNALEAMGPKDAFISIQATKGGSPQGFTPRPGYFGPTSGLDGAKGAGSDLGACIDGKSNLFLRWISFPEQGGGFLAIVAIGRDATPKRQAQVWQILNSLSVTRAA
jgi:hypothetical protein